MTAAPRGVPAAEPAGTREPARSCVYVIANVDVHDPVGYEAYRKLSSIAMQAHGAEICIRGGAIEVFEGDWRPGRIVVLKFPDMAAARGFYDSPEYLAARHAREGLATMRMIAVEGVA